MRRRASKGILLITPLALAACQGVPSYDPNPLKPTAGPPLQDVVEHITCTLGKLDIKKLKDYNFVASINLTMKVSNAEGANATLNFIEPWANSTNFTAILGGSYTATQIRQVNLQYITDLTRVSKASVCVGNAGNDGGEIRGDLGLHDTVLQSLLALNAGAQFNIYGPKGHPSEADLQNLNEARSAVTRATASAPPRKRAALTADTSRRIDDALMAGRVALSDFETPDVTAFQQQDIEAIKQYRSALEALRDKVPSDQLDTLTKLGNAIGAVNDLLEKGTADKIQEQTSVGTFSATIEFQVQEGGGMGPSWTLSTFKGPAAGQTQPLNFNRTTDDTLLITFAPSCYSGKEDRSKLPMDYWRTIQECPKGKGQGAAKARIQNGTINQLKNAERQVILQQVAPDLVGK